MSKSEFDADLHAVRAALMRLRDSDELLTVDQSPEVPAETGVPERRGLARRALVDELIDFLDARADVAELQACNRLDPMDLLLGIDEELSSPT